MKSPKAKTNVKKRKNVLKEQCPSLKMETSGQQATGSAALPTLIAEARTRA
jgi:hypothetical protein